MRMIRAAMTVLVLAGAVSAWQNWDELERRLAADPENLAVRMQLMGHWEGAKRWKSMMWLVEHHPEHEFAFASAGSFGRASVSQRQLDEARRLWLAAIGRQPKSAAIRWNAATFFMNLDEELHLRFLEETAELDPNHAKALRPLAHLYGAALLKQGSAAAGRAEERLARSKNVWVLGNVAHYLQSHYNQGIAGPDGDKIAKLAERYFLMAQKLDGNLKREVILPVAVARSAPVDLKAQFDRAAKEIRRLGVGDFQQLPAGVAGVLRGRGCRVPQPAAEAGGGRKAANVIRGEFVEKGVPGWAVLCSVRGSSTLLVFRSDVDAVPFTLGLSEDRNHLQGLGGDLIGYSRELMPVGEATILRHYRAYGGPKPPPIEHQGIDDAFIGKASVVWYFYRGKWVKLQGAD